MHAMASRSGILGKDRIALERMRSVDAVLFDKTGTLTKGEHVVTEVATADGTDTAPLLRLAAAVEGDSEHPLARAIVGKPLILLADEPTGNLDSKNGNAVMELLQELHADGATICMVTHDPRQAEKTSRTIRMFDGRRVN